VEKGADIYNAWYPESSNGTALEVATIFKPPEAVADIKKTIAEMGSTSCAPSQ
jgi:hypothetical protein